MADGPRPYDGTGIARLLLASDDASLVALAAAIPGLPSVAQLKSARVIARLIDDLGAQGGSAAEWAALSDCLDRLSGIDSPARRKVKYVEAFERSAEAWHAEPEEHRSAIVRALAFVLSFVDPAFPVDDTKLHRDIERHLAEVVLDPRPRAQRRGRGPSQKGATLVAVMLAMQWKAFGLSPESDEMLAKKAFDEILRGAVR